LIEEDVALKQRVCAEDLEKAEPALVAAQAALDTLNKVKISDYQYLAILIVLKNYACIRVDKLCLHNIIV